MSATCDDRSVVTHAGLVPLLRIAENAGLPDLADTLDLGVPVGANPSAKIMSLVAGMAAGADSFNDLDILRHAAMGTVFTGVRAPSTLGSFLRGFSIGHVGALQVITAKVLIRLTRQTPLLPGVGDYAILDLDSKITRVYGRKKVGAKVGYTHVLGYNFLATTLSTPLAAPVILTTRLRGGNADTRRKALTLLTRALHQARDCGATGPLLVRGDSGYFVGALIRAIVDAGASFSITAPSNSGIRTAIAGIPNTAWTPIQYDTPVFDDDTQTHISSAEVAETEYTAFTNTTDNPGEKTTARLIVRRHQVLTRGEQGELFPVWRYHAVFTDTALELLVAEAQHRNRGGGIEHVFADLESSALAHLPSGNFAANAAWLALAALAHNLTRAAGTLASVFHAKARTATIRAHLIAVPARVTRSARRLTLHLPHNWPWSDTWQGLFDTTRHPPPAL